MVTYSNRSHLLLYKEKRETLSRNFKSTGEKIGWDGGGLGGRGKNYQERSRVQMRTDDWTDTDATVKTLIHGGTRRRPNTN